MVLGMHRSGTSMIASMLDALGVHMGDNLMGAASSNPHGHYEDWDFVRLNSLILHDAGGNWRKPPSEKRINKSRLKNKVTVLIRQKRKRLLWGWKDPRTCLTIELYHQCLDNVRYIETRRDTSAIVASLENRDGPGDWRALVEEYKRRMQRFKVKYNLDPLVLDFDSVCANPNKWAKQMAAHLDIDPVYATAATQRVH